MTYDQIICKIDVLDKSLADKARLEDELKELNESIRRLSSDIAEAMSDAEIDGISRHGKMWKPSVRTRYSKKAGADDMLFDTLREWGLGDLIHPTVNANTLSATMADIVHDRGELPPEFVDCINVYEALETSHKKI